MINLDIQINFLEHADRKIALPSYETSQSAGMDLRANFSMEHRELGKTILSQKWLLIPTGLAISIPIGYEAQIRPRSGLALKFGISVLNSPGTIDSDFRGEIGVVLINYGNNDFHIKHGDRIAQIIFAPIVQAVLNPVINLDKTLRDTNGFGSTGVS